MKRDKTLYDLKPGDLVYWPGNRFANSITILKIEKTTKTQIILANGSKYNKKTGRLIGMDAFGIDRISVVAQKQKEHAALLKLRKKAAILIENIKIPEKKKDVEKLIISIEPFNYFN